jgi:hypothetical protein
VSKLVIASHIVSSNARRRNQLSRGLFPYEPPRIGDHARNQMPPAVENRDVAFKLLAGEAIDICRMG